MPTYKLEIEYEGTRFSGWQAQHNAKTVQGTLLNAIRKIYNDENITLQGAGRTDAGVHAYRQIASLVAPGNIPPEVLALKINDLLPYDINILKIEKASDRFHARHNAKRRTYLYHISTRRTAFNKNFVWWIKDKLDISAMKEAANKLTGLHDFSSFSDLRSGGEAKSTKVLIHSAEIAMCGDLILFRISASHFLWKMVRRVVGVLVEVGRGNISPEDFKQLLTEVSNYPAEHTAPPSGLFLEFVHYDDKELLPELKPLVRLL
ncbi:MAG: tRNA pseudouridine(38-40) synthase TruA [Ignavibacteriales bacterium]|nr:MAG: tRNA pseudouridine(38-40) synthase TruA [Ignavibacteriaceae bacterium]MBW7872169.1 tRNA pseudouridine(38-40) synthase TruA [Ignavibacteria bacterium]MCZ2142247.1 tRNA pseudouridine(38-40) synthase TruA [Ignavibacteriales bacterium]OQY74730.1 MAG: tRNA pseudouridine(38-40) synthase TruA [Ignavibacteriales bacterium UTCHB3]MBV6445686.1 tRNA pseudouridine synthase A [Ignavibacteriaceae bacterium]